jgi:predicted ATPase with chaperone activity
MMDSPEESASNAASEESLALLARLSTRFAAVNKPNVLVNGDMRPAEVQRFRKLDKDGSAMIRMAVERMGLSARAYHRILKLSRTIADLAGSEQVQQAHLAEALQYCPRPLA